MHRIISALAVSTVAGRSELFTSRLALFHRKMIASDFQRTSEPPRQFSPEVTTALRSAMRLWWTDPEGGERLLRAALKTASGEAATRGMRPEELVVSMTGIELDVLRERPTASDDDRWRFRRWLVKASLQAYFNPDSPA